MVTIEEEIVAALSQDTSAVLATLVYRAGSAPRDVGAKMLLRADGSSIGTIGGGSVEAKVLKEAGRVIEAGQAKILNFELTAKDLAEEGSICGGNVKVFLEPLSSEIPDLFEIYQNISKIKKRGGRSLLATIISVNHVYSRGDKSKALIHQTGQAIGSLLDDQGLIEKISPEMDEMLRENKAKILVLQREGERVEVLLEPITSEPTVFIFGGGHISTCLAPLVKTVGFKVVVADDRPDFADRERFPEADEVVLDSFEGLVERLRIDENAYLVIVTRGHFHDKVVLQQALQTNARYIGMIGSRRKVRMLYENLMKEGIKEDSLKRVRAPIGLDIGAESPEEIAVSILAELIQMRAGRE